MGERTRPRVHGRMPLALRVNLQTDRSGGPDSCWPWLGGLDRGGYGKMRDQRRTKGVHRVAYELAVGPIPDGMTIDHLCHTADESCLGGITCRHRRCINPLHLEPVTPGENTARGRSGRTSGAHNRRKTHCPKGHPYDEANTVRTGLRRVCRECSLAWSAAYKRRRRAEASRRRGPDSTR
jgi:hypothetical protein